MGKMSGARNQAGGRSVRFVDGRLEIWELRVRERMEKRLEKDDRLTKAGIQVVMDGVQQFPIAIWTNGFPGSQFFRG
jgi:hypothetical protein